MHAELDRWMTDDLRIRGWNVASRTRWPGGAHAAIELAMPSDGALIYQIGGRCHEVRAGEAIVLPAQTEHRTGTAGATRATSFWIGERFAAEAEAALGVRLDEASVRPAARLTALAALLVGEATTSGVGAGLAADGLATALTVELLRRGDDDRLASVDPRVRRAAEQIEAEYERELTVDELARTASLSRFHFTRMFTKAMGASPYRYLVRRRVRAAAALLARPHRSVTEVGLSVGFTDLSRFSRAFKQQMGQSPSAYAAARIEQRSARIA